MKTYKCVYSFLDSATGNFYSVGDNYMASNLDNFSVGQRKFWKEVPLASTEEPTATEEPEEEETDNSLLGAVAGAVIETLLDDTPSIDTTPSIDPPDFGGGDFGGGGAGDNW